MAVNTLNKFVIMIAHIIEGNDQFLLILMGLYRRYHSFYHFNWA